MSWITGAVSEISELFPFLCVNSPAYLLLLSGIVSLETTFIVPLVLTSFVRCLEEINNWEVAVNTTTSDPQR